MPSMSAQPPLQCASCLHFGGEYVGGIPGVHDSGELKCDAFPGGIPDAIQSGAFDHVRPFPGDHGIRYEDYRPESRSHPERDPR